MELFVPMSEVTNVANSTAIPQQESHYNYIIAVGVNDPVRSTPIDLEWIVWISR